LISYAATFDYGEKLPEEFIAVVRNSKTNMFGQSTAYDEIPVYYRQIFDEANTKLPYKFVVLPTGL
jgi:small-conductance mechanosensitive channel